MATGYISKELDMIADLENIISRINEDEAAMLSRTELQYILGELKGYKELQSKYAVLKTMQKNT